LEFSGGELGAIGSDEWNLEELIFAKEDYMIMHFGIKFVGRVGGLCRPPRGMEPVEDDGKNMRNANIMSDGQPFI
jgi:hypothetical protein